ncbi:MAG: hypothetical protein E6K16_03360 [Methanobacteriota archaeon]|nr:MAG: hypothetical protein E6K16_03360 [Euryarchaeota archaeon]
MLPPPARRLPSNRRLVLYLVVLAAFLPEAITGSTPPIGWTNPFLVALLLWLYGAGVLVCRELAVRWRAGWPGILLLGAAYGIIEEGFTVKTMFDPNSPVVGVLGSYGHWMGVNWVWTLWLMIFHAAFSIAFPILLLEWKWPHICGRRLLPDWGLHVAMFLLAGVAVFGYAVLTPYRAGAIELGWALITVILLGYAAYRGWGAKIWRAFPSGRAPKRWVYAAAGFAFFGLSFLVYAAGPALGGTPTITFLEGATLLLGVLLLLRRVYGHPEGERHVFAFVAGSIGMFAFFDIILELAGRTGMAFVGVGFVLLTIWLYRRFDPRPAIITSPPDPSREPPPSFADPDRRP